jgi:hypothetical protein
MQQQWKDAYPGIFGKLITSVMLAVGRDVEQGSYSALYAATSPEVEEEGWNGYYLNDPGQPGKETSQASDPALGAALWNLSERIIKSKVGEDAWWIGVRQSRDNIFNTAVQKVSMGSSA